MKWNKSSKPPTKQGTYLCYGETHSPMHYGEENYYLADYIKGEFKPSEYSWIDRVPSYYNMECLYWTELTIPLDSSLND